MNSGRESNLKRFIAYVLIAMLVAAPALVVRGAGWHVSPLLTAGLFGAAILAAGFMLNWGAETAERHVSQGLVIAVLALVTVLPEYAVDLYYAFQAGHRPHSNYVHYAAANMTGANRLLVGVAWPLVAWVHWFRTRERAIVLSRVNTVEIGFLLLASLYAFVVLVKDRIDLVDFVILLAIFGAYLRIVTRLAKADVAEEDEESEEEPGPAAALSTLSLARQWTWIAGLTVVAGMVVLASAEPFAESIVASGRVLGMDEYLLIQWIAPLASEAPMVTLAVLFVLTGRAAGGLTAMISDKINQWTLLVGMLPVALSLGAGSLSHLPLDARQHEEFFLTAAQSLFGLSVLLRLRLGLASALVLAALFALQVMIAFTFRHDAERAVLWLTALGWVYLGLAVSLFLVGFPTFVRTARAQLRTVGWRDSRAARTKSTPP
jgi:cation:H+ antiporter